MAVMTMTHACLPACLHAWTLTPTWGRQASRYVSQLQELMVPAGYKVKVPDEYKNLPQLEVRPPFQHDVSWEGSG